MALQWSSYISQTTPRIFVSIVLAHLCIKLSQYLAQLFRFKHFIIAVTSCSFQPVWKKKKKKMCNTNTVYSYMHIFTWHTMYYQAYCLFYKQTPATRGANVNLSTKSNRESQWMIRFPVPVRAAPFCPVPTFRFQSKCFGLPVGCAQPAAATHMLAEDTGQHDLFTACDIILQCNYVA